MSKPHLCMIHEAIGNHSAIAKVSMNGVTAALDAGWKVTVVAKFLDESLHDRVEWLRLSVPRRLFFVQWITARHFIKKALGGRRFDLIHAHQPQVASLADVFQCHYLTRMAYLRNSLETRTGLKPSLMRLQERGVLAAEDYFYRRWNPSTLMLFDSELTRQDFTGLYGRPPQEDVLLYSSPPFRPPTLEEKRAARATLVGDHKGPVIGFLGGGHGRKGFTRIVRGLQGDNDVFLLMGGNHCEGMEIPELQGRFRSLGLVSNTAQFYAACDAVVMASLYEPFGLVAVEAASRGIPAIVTPEVGALPHLQEYGAGTVWDPATPLAPVLHDVLCRKEEFFAGSERMADDLSPANYAKRLIAFYERKLNMIRSENEFYS